MNKIKTIWRIETSSGAIRACHSADGWSVNQGDKGVTFANPALKKRVFYPWANVECFETEFAE